MKNKKPLTKKQRNTYDFIEQFGIKNRYMPSLEEIGKRFKISVPSALDRVRRLEQKGWISRSSDPRSITLK